VFLMLGGMGPAVAHYVNADKPTRQLSLIFSLGSRPDGRISLYSPTSPGGY
jgi:hypothetical protein